VIYLIAAFVASSALFSATDRVDPAIVIRHDRADTSYVRLGKRFPAVVKIGRAGDGTLISRDWVLTAAHVAAGVNPDRTIQVGNETYRMKRRVWHPGWRELGPHDIGLIQLDRPVTGVTPLPLYRGKKEVGLIAVLVGHGDTRTGRGGAWAMDGVRRAAMSQVDSIGPGRLIFSFDAPPKGQRLEGAPGRGDSGGPALLEIAGKYYVAGVSSAGYDGMAGPGTYGAVDHFTRVSDYIGWIEQTLKSR
jgi:hypothetical protein